MAISPSPRWVDACTRSLDRQHPYLRIFKCTVFVRDQDRSLRFYLDRLGFRLIADARSESGDRWVAVAPPDGSTILVLVAPKPRSIHPKKRLRSEMPQESTSNQNKKRMMRARIPMFPLPVSGQDPVPNGEASVCNGKRVRQTKMCDFNRLRGMVVTISRSI